MTNIRRHLTFANTIAAIALFVALGGGAVAAIQSKSSAPKPRWAVVDTHGHLVRGSGAVSATQLFTPNVRGSYQVKFNRRVTDCALEATIGRTNSAAAEPAAGEIGVAYRHGDSRAVYVKTRDSSGAPRDQSFHLVVLC